MKTIPFQVGQAFTLIAISSAIANTTKEEIIITSLLPEPVFRPRYTGSTQGAWRVGTFKHKGKRKEYHLDVDPGTLVFAGHGVALIDGDVRFSADGDRGFAGNACYNFAGTPEEIRELILTRNLNSEFTAFDSVLAIPPGDEARTWYDRKRETCAFPEEPTGHAVVQRIREKESATTPDNITPFPSTTPSALADF